MKDDVLIDYAYPCMMAESALKRLHDAMLLKKYDEAMEAAIDAMVEVRMTMNAIRHMKEQTNAVRHQTETVQERVPTAISAGRARKSNGAATSATRH
jgi:hypothetical protein